MWASQLEYVHGISFIESTETNMKGMTKSWLMVLHENGIRFDARATGGCTTTTTSQWHLHWGTSNMHQLQSETNRPALVSWIPSPPPSRYSCGHGQCNRHTSMTRNKGSITKSQIYIHIQLLPGKDPDHEPTLCTVEPLNNIAHDNSTKLWCKLGPWTTSPTMSHPHQGQQHRGGIRVILRSDFWKFSKSHS